MPSLVQYCFGSGSQPNYEEWKLEKEKSAEVAKWQVPSLTMRNGNFFLRYKMNNSDGVPSLTMRNGNDKILLDRYKKLRVPSLTMRNGNNRKLLALLLPVQSSQPNYEEWKQARRCDYAEIIFQVPSLTMRNGNTKQAVQHLEDRLVPSLTMRNGNV